MCSGVAAREPEPEPEPLCPAAHRLLARCRRPRRCHRPPLPHLLLRLRPVLPLPWPTRAVAPVTAVQGTGSVAAVVVVDATVVDAVVAPVVEAVVAVELPKAVVAVVPVAAPAPTQLHPAAPTRARSPVATTLCCTKATVAGRRRSCPASPSVAC